MLISIVKTPHGTNYLFVDESETTREILTDEDNEPIVYIRRTRGCLPTMSRHDLRERFAELKDAMQSALQAATS